MSSAQQTVQELLNQADIKINGNRPQDIRVHNDSFYSRVLAGGSLALGETYMQGLWDCKKLDVFFDKLLSEKLEEKVAIRSLIIPTVKARLFNLQSKNRAFEVGRKHYDIGNDLYTKMLDKTMMYSCAYFKNAKTLQEAQEAKLDLICKKMYLKPGMKILDIGCGWGGFLKFAAEKYKIKGIGITISKEQAKLAQEKCKSLPIEIRFQEYRSLNDQFDRIISIGMFEHVGPKNYRIYFEVVEKNLKDEGLMLLHTIGTNKSTNIQDHWLNTYIFPNSVLPSLKQITQAAENLLTIEDIHNFGPDYDRTLMEWHKNFNANWKAVQKNYDETFFRMWNYYLLCCAGVFRSRKAQLWQIVLSKNRKERYDSIR